MKKTLALLALTLSLMAQEGFDFKTLDKLGVNSTNKTNITLNGDMLKLASGFLGTGAEADNLKPLVDSLKGNTRGVELTYFTSDDRLLVNGAPEKPATSRLRKK